MALPASPHRITIDVLPDEPPNVDVSLEGIGTAITANARLPWPARSAMITQSSGHGSTYKRPTVPRSFLPHCRAGAW
jgi:hypothetical protein